MSEPTIHVTNAARHRFDEPTLRGAALQLYGRLGEGRADGAVTKHPFRLGRHELLATVEHRADGAAVIESVAGPKHATKPPRHRGGRPGALPAE